jgi:hypothetical protein
MPAMNNKKHKISVHPLSVRGPAISLGSRAFLPSLWSGMVVRAFWDASGVVFSWDTAWTWFTG